MVSVVAKADAPATPAAQTGTVKGMVVNADTKPVAGAKVELKQPAAPAAAKDAPAKLEAPAKPKGGDKGAAKPEMKTIATVMTQADGSFKFENVAEGKYMVVASSGETKGRAKEMVTVKAGETADAGTITLMAGKPAKNAK